MNPWLAGGLALGSFAYKTSADDALRTVLQGLDPPPYQVQPRYSISLVVPALNEFKYLGNLLRSARNQVEPFTQIIVADCSDPGEGTAELARSWGAQVVQVPRGNISTSRNLGAAAATGDILVFADADMIWSNHLTEKAVDALEAGAAFVHPKMVMHDSAFWHMALHFSEMMRPASYAGGCMAMFAQDFWDMGGYDETCNMIEHAGDCFEVWEISHRAVATFGVKRVKVLPVYIGASARRFKRFGWLGGAGENFKTPVRAHWGLQSVTAPRRT